MILVPIESAYAPSYQSVIVTMVLSCTVPEIRRLTGQKVPIFPTPLSFGAPAPMFPLEIRAEVNQEETSVMGLSSISKTL